MARMPRRAFKLKRRPVTSKKRKYGRKLPSAMTKRRKTKSRFAAKVMRIVNTQAETKETIYNVCTNMTLYHNSVHNLTNNAFFTNLGTAGEATVAAGSQARVGKDIFVKGIKVSMNLESQQYRPQVSYWLYLIRNKVDPDTSILQKAEMFEGISSTIPTDYINSDLVQIMTCKKFTLRMPNSGTTTAMSQDGTGVAENGTAYIGAYEVVTNPQKLTKFYIPINRKITYKDYAGVGSGSSIPTANWRYQWVIIPYDNFTTFTGEPLTGGYPCGHITLTTKLIYTDV